MFLYGSYEIEHVILSTYIFSIGCAGSQSIDTWEEALDHQCSVIICSHRQISRSLLITLFGVDNDAKGT